MHKLSSDLCPPSSAKATLAVDFETYYDRDYSLKKLDAWTYVHHPKFDCYLMSVYGKSASGPFEWVGHPKDFTQWEIFNHAILLAHNAAFDSLVFKRLQSIGIIPEWVGRNCFCRRNYVPSAPSGGAPSSVTAELSSDCCLLSSEPTWRCTASMAVYLSAPRSLKGACKQLLDITVDKTQRDKAKGKTGADLFGNDAMEAYALEDARLCFLLWDKYNHLWPETEQELATLTFEWGQHGIAVDPKHLVQSIRSLEHQRFYAVELLPWVEDPDVDTPLSIRKLAVECRKADIPCPLSLAMDDPECEAWEDKYGAEYEWVAAMRLFRRTNMLLKRLYTIRTRSRLFTFDEQGRAKSPSAPETKHPESEAIDNLRKQIEPKGLGSQPSTKHFPYSLKYFGAIPGRWSGDAGFNVQNMPRGELFGVDLRRCFVPEPACPEQGRESNVFIIADLCQIEPRILAWLIDDTAFLDLVRDGVDIYEAHARSTMGYTDPQPLKEVDPAMRSLAKARTLGLGYGCGPKRFVEVAKNLGGIDITFAEAKQTVQDFRAKNPRITRLWNRLDRDFKRSAGGDYHIELPSGRELRYLSVSKSPRGYYTAATERGGQKRKLYGGLLTENLVQATARDVFASQLLAIHRYLSSTGISAREPVAPGLSSDLCPPISESGPLGRVVFHVHDEVIVEVPESQAEEARDRIRQIMSATPDWLPDCPIAAEATIHHHYTK